MWSYVGRCELVDDSRWLVLLVCLCSATSFSCGRMSAGAFHYVLVDDSLGPVLLSGLILRFIAHCSECWLCWC